MPEESAVIDVPPASTIDAVAEIISGRLTFYGALSLVTVLGAVAGVAVVITTVRASEWIPSTMKIVSTASAVVGGVFPVKTYFRWKGLSVLCRNYRRLAAEYDSKSTGLSSAAFARATASFWKLYDSTWDDKDVPKDK